MRDGTPSGFSTMSTCVPSSRNGMSSTARSRDDTLVAVTAGHLVARLDLALHGDEDLDHLHHARRQFVAALQLLDLVDEARSRRFLASSYCLLHGFEFGHRLLVAERPICSTTGARNVLERFVGDLAVFLKPFGPEAASLPIRKSLRRP
jgi:hypothetical protein